MLKIRQTKFGKEGNCYAACIASIFELDIESLKFTDNFVLETAIVSVKLGIGAMLVEEHENSIWLYDGLNVAIGPSVRGYSHAVVARGYKYIWDPHPSDAFLLYTTARMEFYPIDMKSYKKYILLEETPKESIRNANTL